jgi:hypothetical protein
MVARAVAAPVVTFPFAQGVLTLAIELGALCPAARDPLNRSWMLESVTFDVEGPVHGLIQQVFGFSDRTGPEATVASAAKVTKEGAETEETMRPSGFPCSLVRQGLRSIAAPIGTAARTIEGAAPPQGNS